MSKFQTLVMRITDEEEYNAVHQHKWQIAGARVKKVSCGDRLSVCDEMYERIEEYCAKKCSDQSDCDQCPLTAAQAKWEEVE